VFICGSIPLLPCRFHGFAYNLKAIADYETGPGSEISAELATEAIEIAKRFVARIAELIAGA